jgi:hypothetical protein
LKAEITTKKSFAEVEAEVLELTRNEMILHPDHVSDTIASTLWKNRETYELFGDLARTLSHRYLVRIVLAERRLQAVLDRMIPYTGTTRRLTPEAVELLEGEGG